MQGDIFESLLPGVMKPIVSGICFIVIVGSAFLIALNFYKIRFKSIIKKIEKALSKNDLNLAKKYLRDLTRLENSSKANLEVGSNSNKLTNVMHDKINIYLCAIQELEKNITQYPNEEYITSKSFAVSKKRPFIFLFFNKVFNAICFTIILIFIIGCPLLITKYMKNINGYKIMSGGMILVVWVIIPLSITILSFLAYERFKHRC